MGDISPPEPFFLFILITFYTLSIITVLDSERIEEAIDFSKMFFNFFFLCVSHSSWEIAPISTVETFSDGQTYILGTIFDLCFQNFQFQKNYTQKTSNEYGKHDFDKINLGIWL